MATDKNTQIKNLPPEILAKIFTEHGLRLHDLAQVARVCKAFMGEATRANYLYNIKHQRSSVLIMAAQQGRIDWMKTAIVMGADVNTVGPGQGETQEELYDYWRNETYPDDGTYGTPLHYATLRGDDDAVDLLLLSGADLYAASYDLCECMFNGTVAKPSPDGMPRWLPLHHAVCQGHVSTANLLLDHDAPLEMSVKEPGEHVGCDSLIHWAAARGLVTLVQRAMDLGTSACAPSYDETTALHYTSLCWNSEDVIHCLLSAGADVDEKNDQDQTALDYACRAGNFSTAMKLLEAGAGIGVGYYFNRHIFLKVVASGGDSPIAVNERPQPLDDQDQEQIELLRTSIEDYGLASDEGRDAMQFDTEWQQQARNASLIAVACSSHNIVPGVVKLLLDKFGDPNQHHPPGKEPLQRLLENLIPSTGKWFNHDKAEKYRDVIYMLLEHGARVSHLEWPFLGKMRLLIRNEKMESIDRKILRHLLKKAYEEFAVEDETLADVSRENDPREDESGDDEAEQGEVGGA